MQTQTPVKKNARVVADPFQEKLDDQFKAAASGVKSVLQRMEKESQGLRDFIAPLGMNVKGNKPTITFGTKENVGLTMAVQSKQYGLHKHAVGQAATRLGIPTAYAKELAYGEDWAASLLAHSMNEHSLHTKRNNVLLRMVDQEVRGVLSDKYRRLDSGLIYSSFLKAGANVGARVMSAFSDDTRSWIDIMLPTVIPIETEKNGLVSMGFGARIGNSDFGDGRLQLSAYSIQMVCMNGMTRGIGDFASSPWPPNPRQLDYVE